MKKFIFSVYFIFATLGSLQARETAVVSSMESFLSDSRPRGTSPDARPEIESQVFKLINLYRKSQSLPLLQWSSLPAHLARQHSLDMSRGVVPFGHDGFAERYAILKAAMPTLTSMGENVAWNQGFSDPAQAAVDAWLSSPDHLANIEGDYNLSGVGVGENSEGQYYFTQIFVKVNPATGVAEGEVVCGSCVYSPPIQLKLE